MRIHRGQVWTVDFGPNSIGDEIRKERPAVVLSDDSFGTVDLRVVVPLTTWQSHFATASWMVRIDPSAASGLDRMDAADTFQVKSVSTKRFLRHLGTLSAEDMVEIVTAVGMVLHHP